MYSLVCNCGAQVFYKVQLSLPALHMSQLPRALFQHLQCYVIECTLAATYLEIDCGVGRYPRSCLNPLA